MIASFRSALVRLRRPRMLAAWLGLTAMFAVLINVVMFQIVAHSKSVPANGPGTSFPALAQLESAHGLAAGLAAAGSFFGVITLAFWAVAGASDYQSGLIRVLATGQPRRWKLLAGQALALALWTAAATLVAVVLTIIVAPVGAHAAGVSTAAWRAAATGTLAKAAFDLYASLLVWGAIGLLLAVTTRSSAIAITCGVAYVLIVEPVITAAAKGVGHWLPGQTLTALAHGGTSAVSYSAASALAATYTAIAAVVAVLVVIRRDITD